MIENYQELTAESNELLKEYGTQFALLRTGPSFVDPVTDIETLGETIRLPTYGVAVAFNKSVVDGTRVRSTDLRVTIASTQPPRMSDKLLRHGVEYVIVDIIETSPAGDPVVFVLQVRA